MRDGTATFLHLINKEAPGDRPRLSSRALCISAQTEVPGACWAWITFPGAQPEVVQGLWSLHSLLDQIPASPDLPLINCLAGKRSQSRL